MNPVADPLERTHEVDRIAAALDAAAGGDGCLVVIEGPAGIGKTRLVPAGLGQTVGETGWRLSQGERARLCLARALLADHDVLILDEPLGALDPQTARRVLDVARRRSRTLVVISQE